MGERGGGGRGIQDMEFEGLLVKASRNSTINLKRSGFSRGD